MHIESSPLVTLQLQLLQRKNMAQLPDPIFISTKADWDYLRPIITKLYVGDGLELKDVVDEIKTHYGFKAT
jgi:hypothetical protein